MSAEAGHMATHSTSLRDKRIQSEIIIKSFLKSDWGKLKTANIQEW